MVKQYNFGDILRNEYLANYFSKKLKIIFKSCRDSKFLFFLQFVNFILAVYIFYQIASNLNVFLPVLEPGFLNEFIIFMFVFFLFFVFTILELLLGKTISAMVLFQTKLSLTLFLTLFFMGTIFIFHGINNRIKILLKENE